MKKSTFRSLDSVTGPCFLSSTNVLQWTSSSCAPWKNFKAIRENLSFYYITAFGWKRSHFTNAFGQCFCNILQLQCNTAVTHQFLFLRLDTLPPGGEKINTLKMLESFFFFHFSHSWWCSLLKTMSQMFFYLFIYFLQCTRQLWTLLNKVPHGCVSVFLRFSLRQVFCTVRPQAASPFTFRP